MVASIHFDAFHRHADRLVMANRLDHGDTALVSLTNLDADDDAAVLLDLRGRTVTGHSARILTAPKLRAHNMTATPDAVVVQDHDDVHPDDGTFGHGLRVELPRHSHVTLELTSA